MDDGRAHSSESLCDLSRYRRLWWCRYFFDSAGGCSGDRNSALIRINPLSVIGLRQGICGKRHMHIFYCQGRGSTAHRVDLYPLRVGINQQEKHLANKCHTHLFHCRGGSSTANNMYFHSLWVGTNEQRNIFPINSSAYSACTRGPFWPHPRVYGCLLCGLTTILTLVTAPLLPHSILTTTHSCGPSSSCGWYLGGLHATFRLLEHDLVTYVSTFLILQEE